MFHMRKVLRGLVYVFAGFVGLVIILTIVARTFRGAATSPKVIHGRVMATRNLFTYMYGVQAGGQTVLFDAGIDEEGRALDVLLGGLHASRDTVADIFLSHGHFDHVVAAVPSCTRARIHVGQPDVDMMALRAPTIPTLARWLSHMLPPPAIEATHPVRERAEFVLADGSKVTAIPFAGHTPGSYLYVYEGVMFAGDSLQIYGDHLEFAMSLTSVDMVANRRNAARLAELLGDLKVDVVCTGHQGCTPPPSSSGESPATAMLKDLIARAKS